MNYREHYEREATRLRVIIEALAFVEPDMPLSKAAPLLFEIEAETFHRESLQLRSNGIELPDTQPETVARLIDLQPSIQDLITGGKKINGIKEVRTLTGLGLKESKEGVEHWHKTRPLPATRSSPAPSSSSFASRRSAPPASSLPADVAVWIIGEPSILSMIQDGIDGKISSGKIHVIKEIRAVGALGLKESKEGLEEYMRTYRPGESFPTV